ncbi:MAG: DoxX family protein [Gordonia sp. (in: high G+C Gram-positive bacteria)]
MIDTPSVPWLSVVLAVILLADAVMSVRAPAFIRGCLEGVGFPREWWWCLIVIKALAGVGLLLGLSYPGVGATVTAGVVAYFGCAAFAHWRARFLGSAFWINCLGLLGFSVLVLIVSYV